MTSTVVPGPRGVRRGAVPRPAPLVTSNDAAVADVPVVRLPTIAAIADLAYSLHLSRGGEHGHDVDDWLDAERILLSRRQEPDGRD